MISPGRQAIFICFSLILLSVQELESKGRISVQELEFKDGSERDDRMSKEGSYELLHKNNQKNQKEERRKKAKKQKLGTKSENRKRNIKAEEKKNMRKLSNSIQKKKRKSSSKYGKNKTKKEKTKIKWRIHKRRMKSSKRRDQKFERSGGKLNLTDCVDKIKFYSRLSVPSRKASGIIRQAKRIRGHERIQTAKLEKSNDFDDTMLRLLGALGGNASNPACRGEEILNGSVEASYAGALATLLKCNRDILDACRHPDAENETSSREIKECEALANDFMSDFEECLQPDLNLRATCLCAENINATNIVSILKCDLSKYSSAALKRKKACKESVRMCKSAQAIAVAAIDDCKEATLHISFHDLISKCS